MIVVHCKCGSELHVPDEWAGKRARCKSCGAAMTIPAETPDGLGDAPLTLIPEDDDLAGWLASEQRSQSVTGPPSGIPEPIIERAPDLGKGRGAYQGFWKDCISTVLFFIDPGSLAAFLLVVLLSILGIAAVRYLGCFGLLAYVFCNGLIAAFLFNVVIHSAGGEDGLPDLTPSDEGVWGVVGPLFKFMGTCAVVFAPASAYRLAAWYYGWTDAKLHETIYLVLLVLGVISWPMVVLAVSIGDFSVLWRPDLIVRTIFRTMGAYLLVCLFVAGATIGSIRLGSAVISVSSTGPGGDIAATVLMNVALLYGMIVSMRVIGLYYHHFKGWFAWSWG